MTTTIVKIAGDGVGPELLDSAVQVIDALGVQARYVEAQAGAGALAAEGHTCPQRTLDLLRQHAVALKGPFSTPNGGTVRSANYYIRRELDLFSCLRPLHVVPGKPPVLLLRENTEDLYGAHESSPAPGVTVALKVATDAGCRRFARHGFELARREGRRLVTIVHKANNLKLTEGLFLDVAREVGRDYPEIEVDDMLADSACAELVLNPSRFDVLLTTNTIGDIMSSVGAAVAGSNGLVGSLNESQSIVVAEAAHGDASGLAGRGEVNPIAFLEGVEMLLRRTGDVGAAQSLAHALSTWRAGGPRGIDLGGHSSTQDVTDYVCRLVRDRS